MSTGDAQPGDTVFIEPGQHSAGVSIRTHLILRGSRAYMAPLLLGDFIGNQMLRSGNLGFVVRGRCVVWLADGVRVGGYLLTRVRRATVAAAIRRLTASIICK